MIPAAADAVAPIFTLLVRMLLAARSFMRRRTKAVGVVEYVVKYREIYLSFLTGPVNSTFRFNHL